MKHLFERKDIFFIGVLLLISILLFSIRYFLVSKQGNRIVITVDDEVYGTYSLMENQEIPIIIDGELTDTVTIADGYAYMSDATCPDQLCKKMGKVSKDQETIVCLPYQIVVTVDSSEENSYDSIAQ